MANPIVTITMTDGSVMKAELYPEVAPNTVNNFISLVKKGFYDGLVFHREPEWAVLAIPSKENLPITVFPMI